MGEMTEQSRKLLIVEDDPGLLKQLKWCFEGYDICTAENREDAIAELRRHEPAVILQDLGLPPNPEGVEEGLATLTETLRLAPHTKVIVVTGNGDQENALTAVAQGAYDFYEKPVDTDTLKLLVDRAFNISELEGENRRLQHQVNESPLDGIVAASEGMLAVCRMIEKVAPTDVTTLLLGESGTGKELLARALHRLSPRADANFVAINCAAIPKTCSSPNCSATRKARSRARTSRRSEKSNLRVVALSSSMRSAICRWRCRRRCCASSRNASSNALAGARKSPWTCAWCALPIRILKT